MRLTALPLLLTALSLPAAALAQSPAPCPFSPAELKAQLGLDFQAGVPESGIVGKACTYKAKDLKLWIDAGPLPVPTAAQWRKMSTAPGASWKPVAGDPDKAVTESPAPGILRYPSVSYERKAWLVNLTLTGVQDAATVDGWNAKLLKLKRLP